MATVVFDADGVLWSGLILHGEDVILTPGVADLLKELKKRGHRVVCCSRNDADNLIAYLRRFGLVEYFDLVIARWGAKSESFAEFVDFGPTLFIDDEPFNLADVSSRFPHVEGVLPPKDTCLVLLDHPTLSRSTSVEDRERVRLLREKLEREAGQAAYGLDFQQFLRDSALCLTIYASRGAIPSLPRVLDLLNRTNELRTAPARYAALPSVSGGGEVVAASLVDRYGDYGIIATVLLELSGPTATIADLAVSCRTMGRGVGTALVAWVAGELPRWGCHRLVGVIRPSDRNGPMRQLYEFLGFTPEGGDKELWEWVVGSELVPAVPPWFSVRVVRE